MAEKKQIPDLAQCADEPIHIPGSIQPHGILIAVTESDLRIVHLSENVLGMIGQTTEQLLGRSLEVLMGELQLRQLLGEIAQQSAGSQQPLRIRVKTSEGNNEFEAFVHRNDGLLIFELVPAESELQVDTIQFFRTTYEAMSQIQGCNNIETLLQQAADYVRLTTGFDRVMVYIFDQEFNGVVLAESRSAESDSYLLNHFPASDIPVQARALYRKNRFRHLVDINYAPAQIQPSVNPLTNNPLDLSYSVLRSMSPVHLEYLRNMGVRSSMSVSLVSNENLRGLIACHHSEPLMVSYKQMVACDLIAQLVASKMAAFSERDDYQLLIKLQAARKDLLNNLPDSEGFFEAFTANPFILDVTEARGAAFVSTAGISLTGITPNEGEIAELLSWLKVHTDKLLFTTDSLSTLFAPAEKYKTSASGLLAIPISGVGNGWLLWFRPELIEEIGWAGEPDKSTELDADNRIHPRQSFRLWKQLVTGKSKPWQGTVIESALALRTDLLDMAFSLAQKNRAVELQRELEQLQLLNSELEIVSAELLEARDDAVIASKRKSDMVSVISHDFRSPLTSIHGSLSLLSSDLFEKSETEQKELIDLALGSSAFLLSLINGLLNLEAIESGSLELSIAVVALEVLFEKTIEIVKTNALKSNVRLKYQTTNIVANVDENKMVQILVNLVSNAIKFSPDQGEVELSVEQGPGELVIRVKDQGRGVPPQFRESIFERFKQVEADDRTEKGGTGLGLAICKALIEAHGGSIGVTSEPGKGSTFWLRLPSAQRLAASPM